MDHSTFKNLPWLQRFVFIKQQRTLKKYARHEMNEKPPVVFFIKADPNFRWV